jgi:hypothetical protein
MGGTLRFGILDDSVKELPSGLFNPVQRVEAW